MRELDPIYKQGHLNAILGTLEKLEAKIQLMEIKSDSVDLNSTERQRLEEARSHQEGLGQAFYFLNRIWDDLEYVYKQLHEANWKYARLSMKYDIILKENEQLKASINDI